MQNKKKQILNAAIHCFASKGFHATSIQEIVDELGIAKGSIYFYFKSKNDLLISVFEHYSELIYEGMVVLPDEWELPPRERLSLQIERQFRFIRDHLDFMRMLLKEPPTGLHPQIQQLMLRLRARNKLWNISHLIAIYGQSVERYLGDASSLLSGMISHYFEIILFEDVKFDERRLSQFLVNRLDDSIKGMEQAGEAPILMNPDLAELRILSGLPQERSGVNNKLFQDMLEMININSGFHWNEQTQGDLIAALAILKEEFSKPIQKNYILIRGMVSLLRQHGLEQWKEPLDQLEQQLLQNRE